MKKSKTQITVYGEEKHGDPDSYITLERVIWEEKPELLIFEGGMKLNSFAIFDKVMATISSGKRHVALNEGDVKLPLPVDLAIAYKNKVRGGLVYRLLDYNPNLKFAELPDAKRDAGLEVVQWLVGTGEIIPTEEEYLKVLKHDDHFAEEIKDIIKKYKANKILVSVGSDHVDPDKGWIRELGKFAKIKLGKG
jgi:hypothetical protein